MGLLSPPSPSLASSWAAERKRDWSPVVGRSGGSGVVRTNGASLLSSGWGKLVLGFGFGCCEVEWRWGISTPLAVLLALLVTVAGGGGVQLGDRGGRGPGDCSGRRAQGGGGATQGPISTLGQWPKAWFRFCFIISLVRGDVDWDVESVLWSRVNLVLYSCFAGWWRW
jgi:hypothetical protein